MKLVAAEQSGGDSQMHGFDVKRVKEYLAQIDEFHRDGKYRWEVGFVNQLLWAGCYDDRTTHKLREKRKYVLARLSPLAGACVTGAERVMELLAVKITGKALNAFKEYLVTTLDRPYRKECELLLERRSLDLNRGLGDSPCPENEVFRLTEIVLPKLEKFASTKLRGEQESVYASGIAPYIEKTLARIEKEVPPCWANVCIIAPILRRIRELAISRLEADNKPLVYSCAIDGEWWQTESGGYEHDVLFEIEKNQPEMTNIRLSLEGRSKKWSKALGDYYACLSDQARSQYFHCEIFPTDEEMTQGGGVLHFRLTYLVKNHRQSRNEFREIRFDRKFRLAISTDKLTSAQSVETKDLSVASWLRTRQKTETIKSTLHDSDVVGDYEILGLIGRGGSGEVYSARHRVLGTCVAIKLLFKDSENTRARFANEARILATEKCEGFPQFFAFGDMDGRPYLVEELLSPLDFPTDDEGVAEFLMQFCPTIDFLHKRGYVHRDIKPSNILYRGERPILVDFGLVKKIEPIGASGSKLSIVDGYAVGVGTPGYASPEQLVGEDIDITSDIYALGMMVDGFFEGKLPPQWEPIINKATNSRKRARYQSIEEFLEAVRAR